VKSWIARQADDCVRLAQNSWLTFDRRTLGFTRIILATFLIFDLFRRGAAWEEMFGDKGVLPSFVITNRPQAQGFSLLHGFTTPLELWLLFGVILLVYVLLLVGWKTKVMQILSMFFVASMNGRVLLIENGGYVVQNLLLLWTVFMPLGDRFSVDAMLASMRRKRETSVAELNDRADLVDPHRLRPFVSFVGVALVFQISAIYYFNVVHKTGPDWKVNFSAVHYVLYVDRMVTPIVGMVRDLAPFPILRFMTMSVIAAEALIPFCMFLPQIVIFGFDFKLWLKRFGLILINFLHIGFGSSFVLGPFAWSLCVFSTVLIAPQDWELFARVMRRPSRARTVVLDTRSGAALLFARLVARLDRHGLIGFAEATTAEERAKKLVVLRRDGSEVTGPRAVAEVLAATPVGPLWAWVFRVPPVSSLLAWMFRAEPRAVSRFFGLSARAREARPLAPLTRRLQIGGLVFSEMVCGFVFVAELNQAFVELWSTKKRWSETIAVINKKYDLKLKTQSEGMGLIPHKMRYLQGWFMFSPNPVKDDGVIVCDAVTADGRHIDPYTGQPPNFDLQNARSYGYSQIWSDYFNRIHMSGNRAYRDATVEYLRRLHERTGNPNDRLVSGEVFWVRDTNPRWNTRKSYAQVNELLFTFSAEGGARDAKK
jgi:hypothetical protein